jgi:hypothetical protein
MVVAVVLVVDAAVVVVTVEVVVVVGRRSVQSVSAQWVSPLSIVRVTVPVLTHRRAPVA